MAAGGLHSSQIPRHILLTGPPGIGKTTLLKKILASLHQQGLPTQGFYTEELRERGKRVGFDIVTLEGHRGPLARVNSTEQPGPPQKCPKVGQYNVSLQSFEMTAIPTLCTKGSTTPVFVIDEIGKMELFSASFTKTVQHILNTLHNTVIATVPERPMRFVDDVKRRPDVVLFEITRHNRDHICQDIVQAVVSSRTQFGKR